MRMGFEGGDKVGMRGAGMEEQRKVVTRGEMELGCEPFQLSFFAAQLETVIV